MNPQESSRPGAKAGAVRDHRCGIALAVYDRAAAIFAQRAGQAFTPHFSASDTLLDQAEALALPGAGRAREQQLPALTSLAGHLNGGGIQCYYSPRLLSPDEATVMPATARPTNLAAAYGDLWPHFAAEREQLLRASNNLEVREAGYHALLQRYAWAMPAPTGGDTDVSLFDFARTAAALAVCLDAAGPKQADAEHANADPVALLVGGDLSGVQDWLYTLGSIGAAKSLRGRSFYLQLLCEIIALHVADELALPACCSLYVGGGNLYLLAPPPAAAQLAELQPEITQRLLTMHDGALYLALGWTPLARAELTEARCGDAWGRANQEMGQRKRQRFADLDNADMARAIGSPLANTGELNDTCAVCRRPILDPTEGRPVREDDLPPESGPGSGRVCGLCASFEQLGNSLRMASILTIARYQSPQPPARIRRWRKGLDSLGFRVRIVEEPGRPSFDYWRDSGSNLTRIYYWKDDVRSGAFAAKPKAATAVWAYRPLAQAVPESGKPDYPIATFDDLKAEGIDRWGVLRMDVDNLGCIFQHGLPGRSLSQVVALSGLLRIFFEGYVPTLVSKHNEPGPSAYLMYAGGDDLFIVAGWSHLPEIAWEIREALVAFTGHNPHVTISGGIAIAPDKAFPIYQAARMAGDAEHKAKDAGKNRLAFLDQVVPWDGEPHVDYVSVRNRVDEVRPWIVPGGALNRSFLMRLRAIYAEWIEWRIRERPGQVRPLPGRPRYEHRDQRLFLGPWQWHLVYSLKRAVESKDETLQGNVKQLIADIIGGEITVLGMEARWIEYATRVSSTRKEGDAKK